MPIDRFTLFGLALALLGWAVLLADAAAGPALTLGAGFAMTAMMRSDIFTVAETAILSGFALAILGVLRAGFGALHAFFGAVLERADGPKPTPAARAAPQPAPSREPILEPLAEPIMDLEPAPWPKPAARPASGPARARNYVILPNGAVEVETLLGTRVFASMDEARDYIR